MAKTTITETYDFDEVLQTEQFTFADGREITLDGTTELADLHQVLTQISNGPRADRYRGVVSGHLTETLDEDALHTLRRDVAICSHDVIYESPLYQRVRELIEHHPVTERRRRTRQRRDEMVAQLFQAQTWTNARGETVALDDIDVRYARNILGFVRRNERKYAWAILSKEAEMWARGWDGAHGTEVFGDWLEDTPLVRALVARVEGASRTEHLLADTKQAARKLRYRLTGSWD